VFADEKKERNPLAEFHALHQTGRDFYPLPPTDVRVKHPAEVVLVDLSLVQRPAIELVLANVKPVFAGGLRVSPALLEPRADAAVYPVLRQAALLRRGSANADVDKTHTVVVQKRLELRDIALVDGALRQHDHVDAVDLIASREDYSVEEIQIELLRRSELEQAKELAVPTAYRSIEWAEV